MLQLTDKHDNSLMVELSGDGTYWNVNTAGIFNTSYGAKNNVVYNRPTSVKQPAETAEATQVEEQGGNLQTSSRNNTPAQHSASKGNEIFEENNISVECPVVRSAETARQETDTAPTSEAQVASGNYKKSHIKIDEYNISLEFWIVFEFVSLTQSLQRAKNEAITDIRKLFARAEYYGWTEDDTIIGPNGFISQKHPQVKYWT